MVRMALGVRHIFLISSLAFVLAVSSCSTTRSLQEGEYRLAKNTVNVTNGKNADTKDVQSYIKQKPNPSLVFGWNPFLVIYNWAGRYDNNFLDRFCHKIGTPPVVYDPTQLDESIENICKHLEYIGYYDSKVDSDVEVSGRKVKVKYNVTLGKRYKISNIQYSIPEGEFRQDFSADSANIMIKPGDYLSESNLEKETERSAAYFRRHGYYGFTKNFYSFTADTLARNDTCGLLMTINNYTRNETPENARPLVKYKIGDVTISHDKDLKFNEKVLRNMNTLRPGALYDERDVNNTYARLSALRIFSGVNMQLTPRDSEYVDCAISLTQSKTQGFKVNLEGSTNSSGLIGISPQFSYFHKNIFRGGQWLNLGFLGNFQFKSNDRKVHSNELGVTANLSFPEFLGLPNSMFKGALIPRTEINTSYNYQSRPEYTRNMISGSFGYSGSLKNFYYQFEPLRAKIVKLYHLDTDFYETLKNNLFLRDAYQDHFDAGSSLTAYYTTCSDLNPKVSYRYVRFQFDVSGNVMSLFNGGMSKDAYGHHLIWGTPYSQYVRAELTLGNTFVFGGSERQSIAMRFLGGIGKAYGNSQSLPLERQFYSGGANSMRGWQARDLGPGRMKGNKMFSIPSQTGDMKLEANLEYRFPMFWKLYGALFTDVGNIWTIREEESEDWNLAKFSMKNFGKSLAANWGLGVRVDLNFLILRLDMGIKMHDPSLARGERWFGPDRWFSNDGFAVHFGVGYPF